MSYDVKVTVRFDHSGLCEHEWRPETFGLAKMLGARTCTRCGLADYEGPKNVYMGGIGGGGKTNFWRTRAALKPAL